MLDPQKKDLIEKALKSLILCHKSNTKLNTKTKKIKNIYYDIDEEVILDFASLFDYNFKCKTWTLNSQT
jgi:hypothetical protein